MLHRKFLLLLTALLAACAGLRTQGPVAEEGTRAELALLETTDLHANVLSYDYFKLAADPSLGFERTATLIRAARAEFPNSLLFDAGDTIQGTALSDYQAQVQKPDCGRPLAIYAAMDALGYDGGTLGNHEFNYGLPFLSRVTGRALNVDGVTAAPCTGPKFPLVLSNVFSARDGKPLYAPYLVLNKSIQAIRADGTRIDVPLRVGLLGFTPPPILDWDKKNLAGKVTVMGLMEAAQRYLPELQAQGVDLVVVISHGGIKTTPYVASMESANWHLAALPGIDALLLGHSHALFPDLSNAKSAFQNLPEVDNARGQVRGVPSVMGGFWGKHLGVIKLALAFRAGRWQVDRAQSASEVRPICVNRSECVVPDPSIAPLVAAEHAATIQYVRTPIGSSSLRMSSYFADLGEVSALSVVNAAQRDFTIAWLKTHKPEYAELPVLSAASAFKTGFAGPEDYTDIPPGPLTISSAADLYFYPNTISALKIDGSLLKSWLERSAERFNQIDPNADQPQPLISKMPGYNFDVIQGGLRYVIDVTRPNGSRITTLEFAGKPVALAQEFIVVTNNYRASGAEGFTFLPENLVMSEQQSNREVLSAWLKAHPQLQPGNLEPRPWRFAPVATRAPVTFVVRNFQAAAPVASGVPGLRLLQVHDDGSATYQVRLGD